MLLIGVTIALFSDVQSSREIAHNEVAKIDPANNSKQINEVLLTDGSSPLPSLQSSLHSPQEVIGSYTANTTKKNSGNSDFDSLIDTIHSTVQTKTWTDTGGGEAKIRPFKTNLSLSISQSQSVREEMPKPRHSHTLLWTWASQFRQRRQEAR